MEKGAAVVEEAVEEGVVAEEEVGAEVADAEVRREPVCAALSAANTTKSATGGKTPINRPGPYPGTARTRF